LFKDDFLRELFHFVKLFNCDFFPDKYSHRVSNNKYVRTLASTHLLHLLNRYKKVFRTSARWSFIVLTLNQYKKYTVFKRRKYRYISLY